MDWIEPQELSKLAGQMTDQKVSGTEKSFEKMTVRKLDATLASVRIRLLKRGAVAQLVRVPDCRSGGCGFESRRPRLN